MIIGLTGNIASGKSTVAKTFAKHNILEVDADQVARDVVVPFTSGYCQIVDTFDNILNFDLTINRAKLGQLVFHNPKAMVKLNAIMGLLIQEESIKQLNNLSSKIKIYNAALIIESGNADKYRPLVVVYCQPEIQLERLMKRNSLSKEDALARINSQMPAEEKIKLADFVIDTSDSIEGSIKQTEEIIKKITVK